MTYEEIKQFVAKNINYLDWEFFVNQQNDSIYLQIRFKAEDNYEPGKFEVQYCRKYQLSVWMTPTEIVQTAWAAVQRAVLHEASEQFKYKGQDIYNTHIRVDKLAQLRQSYQALEHRPPATVVP